MPGGHGIDELFDIAAVEQQKQTVLSTLRDVTAEMQKLGAMKIGFSGAEKTKDVVSGINDLGNSMQTLSSKISEAEKAQRTYTRAQLDGLKVSKEQAAIDRTNAQTSKELANTKKAEAQTAKENAKAKEAEAKYTSVLTKEKERLDKIAEREKANAAKLTNAYEQLKLKYRDTANEAKRLGVELGVESQEFKDASAAAMKYWTELDHVETSVGQAQRRVGQYERAQFSLNQVIREAPAFVNSFSTGIMAISNNLPMLKDEFEKLRESTGSTGSALKVMLQGLFSWNTALILGITVMAAYGKEIAAYVESLFKGESAMDVMVEKQKILNESLSGGNSEYAKATQLVDELTINIDLAKRGFIDKDKVVKQYNETIGKTTGEVKTLKEAEIELQKNAEAYVNMMLYKAAATLALQKASEKAVEAAENALKAEKDFAKTSDEFQATGSLLDIEGNNASVERFEKSIQEQGKIRKEAKEKQLKKEQEEFRGIAKGFSDEAAKIAKENQFDLFGGEFDDKDAGEKARKAMEAELKAALELMKYRKEQEAKFQEDISSIQFLADQKRIDAKRAQIEAEIAALKIQSQIELQDEDVTASGIIKIREKLANDIIQKEADLTTAIIQIKTESAAAQKKLDDEVNAQFLKDEADREKAIKEAAKKRLEDAEDRSQGRGSFIGIQRDSSLAQLEKDRAAGLVTEQEYQAKKLAIEQQYEVYSIKALIDYLKEVIGLRKEAGESVIDEEAKIQALELKLLRVTNDTKLKEEKRFNDERKKMREQLGKEAVAAVFEIASFSFEKQKNDIQDQIDLLEQRKQKEIEVANATITNEQDRAAAITTISARAAAQREQLELRQRRIEQDRARFEKLAAVLTIGIDTAKKVFQIQSEAALLASNPLTVALAPAALAQIPFVIASGAIAAALIAAKPIPKYKEGTKNHPGGLAVLGDGGRSELAVSPDGNLYLSGSSPEVVDLPKHTVVYKDAREVMEDVSGFGYKSLRTSPNLVKSSGNKELIKEIRSLKATIENTPTTVINNTYSGLMISHQRANSYHSWVTANMQSP